MSTASSSHAHLGSVDYERIARELVTLLRGRRSQASFSRRLGYRSNVVHRWEAGICWPSAATFLKACEHQRIDLAQCFTEFFQRRPAWLEESDHSPRQMVAAFLRQLRGRTPILKLAKASGFNRFTVSRWLQGTAQPKLPEFLCLVDAASRRLPDFVAALVDPTRVRSLAQRWQALEDAREAAYREPWSHAVLHALELDAYSGGNVDEAWLADRLGIDRERLQRCLEVLAATNQVREDRGRWRPSQVATVHTAQDRERAQGLKLAWTEIALSRQRMAAPGHYGYSVFSISRADLRRLRDLHVEYLRAMQNLIFNSESNECVALYCAQLVDLSLKSGNALE